MTKGAGDQFSVEYVRKHKGQPAYCEGKALRQGKGRKVSRIERWKFLSSSISDNDFNLCSYHLCIPAFDFPQIE